MGEQERSDLSGEVTSNQFYTSATALQIRLNVEPLIAQLELDIRGLKEHYNNETGQVELVKSGQPLFSKEVGIQSYISFVRSVVNTQVVQGNFDEDSYAEYMTILHRNLATDFMVNRRKYGLDKYHYQTAINLALQTIRGYLTRPIGNKERESYSSTMKHVESSNTVAGKTGGFFNFGGR